MHIYDQSIPICFKMKNKILLIALLFILACSFTACRKDKKTTNEETNETTKTEQVVKGYTEEDMVEINGIQTHLFNETTGELSFILQNESTGESFNILPTSTFTDFFEYVPLTSDTPEVEVPEELPLQPGETSLYVYTTSEETETDEVDGVFVFGAANESDTELYFKDARTVYISYYGNPEWKLCGIATEMSMEEVKEIIGEPAQDVESDLGRTFSYFVLKDDHTYTFLLTFDKNECVEKMELNVDNYPIYIGQYVE